MVVTELKGFIQETKTLFPNCVTEILGSVSCAKDIFERSKEKNKLIINLCIGWTKL